MMLPMLLCLPYWSNNVVILSVTADADAAVAATVAAAVAAAVTAVVAVATIATNYLFNYELLSSLENALLSKATLMCERTVSAVTATVALILSPNKDCNQWQ